MGDSTPRSPAPGHAASGGGESHGAHPPGEHDLADLYRRGWDTFLADELATILGRFEIGTVERAHEYRRGSRSAPKLKLWTSDGTYLLKRRSTLRHPVARIRFAQAIQSQLERKGYPVAPLLRVRETGSTLLLLGDYAYELFRFIEGDRFDKSGRLAGKSGEALGELHRITADLDPSAAPPASYHDSPSVRKALDHLADAIQRVEPGQSRAELESIARELRLIYARATDEIDVLGMRGLGRSVVHGDWHPGNLIFGNGGVLAVIDFDSARAEAWVTEIANGMLQFALQAGQSRVPEEWPDDLDPHRLRAFLTGYLTVAARPLSADERAMVPWLMIEAMIAESAIPVATHGTFADLSGASFMRLVLRKCQWVRHHRKAISEL